MPTERTPLTMGSSTPLYVFHTNRDRLYRQRVRRMQCCICAGILTIMITALLITLSYTIDNDDNDATNTTSTPDVPSTNFSLLPTSQAASPLTLSWPLEEQPLPTWIDLFSKPEIESAISYGRQKLSEKEMFEEKVPSLPVDTPSFRHRIATSTSPEARQMARVGFIMEAATRKLTQRMGKKPTGRSKVYEIDWLPKDVCSPHAPSLRCQTSRYRTYDGKCNNLNHPRTWGVGMTPFRRLIPPTYADGISAPRKAKDGSSLPSAREVSMIVHRSYYEDDPNFTVMLAVWGQFIDHDITATASSQGKSGEPISCCYGFLQAGLRTHQECYTVRIAGPDPFYSQKNVTCLEFVRSAPAPICTFGPREQMNQASAYIDGSAMYGKSEEEANSLRTFRGGELATLTTPTGIQLLPISTDSADGCNQMDELAKGRYCFVTGDARANENIHLTTMHLLWVRQHNKIAHDLSQVNPHWEDERIFQETRRIIAAQLQHIHYNEFLPVVLGRKMMQSHKLLPKEDGYSDYDPNMDASIANGFATSAYRFGHTLLPGLFRAVAGDNSSDEYIEMHKMLFNPFRLYEKDFIEKAVRGALETPLKKQNNNLDGEFTQHLFERERKDQKNKSEGSTPQWKRNVNAALDLVSLNVQRGRDHGLPGYPYWRELCGLSRPTTFDDMTSYIENATIVELKSLFRHVDDIDMYTGAVSEVPIDGSIVGPTITCILLDQFLRLQKADRFWYESAQSPYPFTPDQLNTIRETTLAKVICDTSYVDQAQKMVMERKGPGNERRKCSDLPTLDIKLWKEERLQEDETSPADRVKKALSSSHRVIKLRGRVTSGTAVVEGVEVWNSLPVKLPMRPLDAVAESIDTLDLSYPPVFANGILWSGKISSTQKTGKVEADISLPRYIHSGKTVQVSWYNGHVSLDLKISWTSNGCEDIHLQGQYSSPIYYRHDAKYAYLRNSTYKDLTTVPIASQEPLQEKSNSAAPIILLGVYSEQEDSFLWGGEVVVLLPNNSQSEDSFKPLRMAYTPKSYVKNNKIGGHLVGGGILRNGSTVWDGKLPLAIPVNPLEDISEKKVFWDGSFLSVSATSGTLSGHIWVQRSTTKNSILTKQWYKSDFMLDFDVPWSTPGVASNINGKFMTPVHLLDGYQYEYLKDIPPTYIADSMDSKASDAPYEEGALAPLTLLGTFSRDMKSFLWSGNFTIDLPEEVEILGQKLNLQAVGKDDIPLVSLRLVGGAIKVGGETVWNNELPVAFPTIMSVATPWTAPSMEPITYGQGILWNASIGTQDSPYITFDGEFSLPFFEREINNSLKWLNGNFSLRFQTNETFSLSGPYATRFFYMEEPTSDGLEEHNTNRIDGYTEMKSTTIPYFHTKNDVYPTAPLLLYGIYSLDKKEFLWSGRCALVLYSKKKQSLPILKATYVREEDMKLAGFVRRSHVSIDGKSMVFDDFQERWQPIPVAVMSSVAASGNPTEQFPGYAQGLLWSGELQTNQDNASLTISGKFSLPIQHHQRVAWYNGNFSFEIEKMKCNFDPLQKAYSSTIYFRERITKFSGKINATGEALAMEPTSTPDVTPDAAGSASIILYGRFTADKRLFLWSGEVFAVFSNTAPSIQIEDKSELKPIRVTAFTNGGSLTVGGVNVWVGNRIPLSIHTTLFEHTGANDNHTMSSLKIPWEGSIRSEGFQTIRVKGAFSKQTNSTSGWYNGEFALEFKSYSPPPKLELNGTYTTSLYLHERIADPSISTEWTLPNNLVSSAAPSHRPKNVGIQLSLFVHGKFSPNRQTFICTGNVTIVINEP